MWLQEAGGSEIYLPDASGNFNFDQLRPHSGTILNVEGSITIGLAVRTSSPLQFLIRGQMTLKECQVQSGNQMISSTLRQVFYTL